MNGTIKCTLLVLAMTCSMLAGCGNSTSSDFSTIGVFPGGGPSAWKVQQSTTFSNNTTVVTNYSYNPTSKFLTNSAATTTSGAGTETTTTTYSGFDTYGNPATVSSTTTPSGKTVITSNTYLTGTLYTSTTTTTIGGTTTSIGQSYLYGIYGKTVTTNFYNGNITATPALLPVKTDVSSFDTSQNLYLQVITDNSVTPPQTTTFTFAITAFVSLSNSLARPQTVVKSMSINGGTPVVVSTKTINYEESGPAFGQVKDFTETFVSGPISKVVGTSTYDTNGNLQNATLTSTISGVDIQETLAETWILP